MPFQVGIGSLGGTVFSGGTLYPSANYAPTGCQDSLVKSIQHTTLLLKVALLYIKILSKVKLDLKLITPP